MYDNKTKLQLFLDAIEPTQQDRNEAVLEYFDMQEEDEYTVGDKYYFIFDRASVENIIREQNVELCKDFQRLISAYDQEYKRIIENLEYTEIIDTIVYDFAYDELDDYNLETVTESEEYYIYTEA